ncbi:hypothetical protein [Streptomyces sp. NPDC058457]|uniref:hypothetical protein n=1 Tax=Streptomyces sp. NPDC058457 TaxID=3346507 RepID=UPI0036564A23
MDEAGVGHRCWQMAPALIPLVACGTTVLLFSWHRHPVGPHLQFIGYVLSAAQFAAPVLALYRAIPAWWVPMLSEAAVTAAAASVHCTCPWNHAWNGSELALKAWVLFLVVLRAGSTVKTHVSRVLGKLNSRGRIPRRRSTPMRLIR